MAIAMCGYRLFTLECKGLGPGQKIFQKGIDKQTNM